MRHNLIIGSLIALTVVILDQWSKIAIFDFLDTQVYPSYEVIPFFNLVKVYNTGVSFGLFQGMAYGHIILSIFAIFITIALFIWLIMAENFRLVVGLSFIIGGAIGNVIDRITVGSVKDFIDFYIGNWHWPAFNIADSAVFIGVCLILIDSFFYNSKHKKKKQ